MTALGSDSEILGKIQDAWTKVSLAFERATGLKAREPPSGAEVLLGLSSEAALGGTAEDPTIRLTPDIARDPVLLFGVVAKECVRSAMPGTNLCQESVNDVGMEFARQCLSGGDQRKWADFWTAQVPEERVDGVLLYRPAKSFQDLYELVAEEGLKEIVRDLVNASRYSVSLDFEDYVRYFEARFKAFSVRLSSAEVKILDALHRNPEATNDAVAAKTGLTPQWVSQKVASLRSRMILRSWDMVHFSKIGIRMYNLLVGTEEPEEDPSRFFVKCPFVYAVRRILTGPWHVLLTLSLPDNIECVRAVDKCLKAINRWGIRTVLNEIVSSGSGFCFDYYDTSKSDWRIPWDLERVQLAKIRRDNLASAFPRLDSPRPKSRLELTELDMRIIDAVKRGKSSVTAVREELRVGQVRVASSLKRLREDGIISTVWESHNVGLVEHVFVSTDDPDIGRAIAAWAQRLPRCIASFDLDGRLMLLASLPSGGAYGLISALEMIPPRVASGLLAAPMYSRWDLPLKLWDVYKQRWNDPEEAIAQWTDSIR